MINELLIKIEEKKAEYKKTTETERDTVKIFRAQGAIEALEKIPDLVKEIEDEERE